MTTRERQWTAAVATWGVSSAGDAATWLRVLALVALAGLVCTMIAADADVYATRGA